MKVTGKLQSLLVTCKDGKGGNNIIESNNWKKIKTVTYTPHTQAHCCYC